jgi:uncharacterized membrane protein
LKTLVAALFLASLNANAALNCVGAEPFWNLQVEAKTMKFTDTQDLKGSVLKILSSTEAAGMATNVATVRKSKFSRLTTIQGECSDGASDEAYTHHAIFEMNNTVLYGCCR